MAVDFEKAFEEFIASAEVEKKWNEIISLLRMAFASGWLAAGGD